MSNGKSKNYTISEMARHCGVSVASISKYVKRNGLKPVETGQNNAKLFSNADFRQIKSYYRDKKQNEESASQSPHVTNADLINHLQETIDDLRKQLNEKDKQIERQSTQIDNLTTAVGNIGDLTKQVASLTSNAQQLQLAEKTIQLNSEKETANTVEMSQNVSEHSSDDSEVPRSWLYRIFHKEN